MTEHIDAIISYIEQLIASGAAYQATDEQGISSVYFSVAHLGASYGRLGIAGSTADESSAEVRT